MTPLALLALLTAQADSLVSPAVIAAIIAALAAIAGAYLTYRQAGRANDATAKKVDLEEHRDSIDRLKRIIDEMDRHQEREQARHRAELDRLNHQLDSVQAQLSRAQDSERLLKSHVATLEDQVRTLRRLVRGDTSLRDVPPPDLSSNSD